MFTFLTHLDAKQRRRQRPGKHPLDFVFYVLLFYFAMSRLFQLLYLSNVTKLSGSGIHTDGAHVPVGKRKFTFVCSLFSIKHENGHFTLLFCRTRQTGNLPECGIFELSRYLVSPRAIFGIVAVAIPPVTNTRVFQRLVVGRNRPTKDTSNFLLPSVSSRSSLLKPSFEVWSLTF